jgi:hypothetical protein
VQTFFYSFVLQVIKHTLCKCISQFDTHDALQFSLHFHSKKCQYTFRLPSFVTNIRMHVTLAILCVFFGASYACFIQSCPFGPSQFKDNKRGAINMLHVDREIRPVSYNKQWLNEIQITVLCMWNARITWTMLWCKHLLFQRRGMYIDNK